MKEIKGYSIQTQTGVHIQVKEYGTAWECAQDCETDSSCSAISFKETSRECRLSKCARISLLSDSGSILYIKSV